MMNIDEIISNLKSLDLKQYPSAEIKTNLNKIGEIGYVINILHKGYELIRLRPNWNGETFSDVSELSYKPQQYNKTYQRASTPNKTMFYACSNQNDNPNANKIIGRATALGEGFPIIRDINALGEWKVTYSKWVVQQDIPLATICFNKYFNTKYPDFEFVYDSFQAYLKNYPQHKDRTLKITEFLAQEFSNPNPTDKTDYLYSISAIFSEIVSEKFDGIIYPSVRTIGEGINIALKPSVIDTGKILCEVVAECIVTRKSKDDVAVTNHSVAYLKNGQKQFTLKKCN